MTSPLKGKTVKVTDPVTGGEHYGRVAGFCDAPVLLLQTITGQVAVPQAWPVEILDDEGVHGAAYRDLIDPEPSGWKVTYTDGYGHDHEVMVDRDDTTPGASQALFHAAVYAAESGRDPRLVSITAVYPGQRQP